MTAEVENLILAQLREMRAEMAGTRAQITALDAKVEAAETGLAAKIDGVSLLLTMLAGHVCGPEGRIEALETRR
jgi:hypothetical protein